jgi:lipid-A-disaccharide synthase
MPVEDILRGKGSDGTPPPRAPKRIMIVAGEASGDLHGGNLVLAMKALQPALVFYGVGGRKMEDAGVELIADCADMAVVGLTEVITRLSFILKIMGRLKALMKSMRPDLVILIDYPDFNLPLARAAKRYGIKVFYYISPQVWAWRKGRVALIRDRVDRMAVILPFEEDLYRKAGVKVTFVGHPLLDVVKRTYSDEEAGKRFGLKEGSKTVALLPGSRHSEVTRILPAMIGAAEILSRQLAGIQFIMPLAETLDEEFVRQIIGSGVMEIKIVRDEIYDVVGAADAAIVTSGTATLETALLLTPMVIVYSVSPLSYHIGRVLIDVENIGLVNIIAGRRIVPELIQEAASPERMAEEVMAILKSRSRQEDMIGDLATIRERLGRPGAAVRAAEMALELLGW